MTTWKLTLITASAFALIGGSASAGTSPQNHADVQPSKTPEHDLKGNPARDGETSPKCAKCAAKAEKAEKAADSSDMSEVATRAGRHNKRAEGYGQSDETASDSTSRHRNDNRDNVAAGYDSGEDQSHRNLKTNPETSDEYQAHLQEIIRQVEQAESDIASRLEFLDDRKSMLGNVRSELQTIRSEAKDHLTRLEDATEENWAQTRNSIDQWLEATLRETS